MVGVSVVHSIVNGTNAFRTTTSVRNHGWIPAFSMNRKIRKRVSRIWWERDADGKFINNKWALNDVSTSTTQSDWSDDYSGFGPDKYQYKYNSSASWIRSRINSSNGFQSWPWLYVNMKFRPHNGDYRTHTIGGAVDYPIMRIEEMYFLKAEAALHTSGVPAAAKSIGGYCENT